jgi:hypothetical protein
MEHDFVTTSQVGVREWVRGRSFHVLKKMPGRLDGARFLIRRSAAKKDCSAKTWYERVLSPLF